MTDSPAGDAPPHKTTLDKQVLVIAGVVVLGAIMSILDVTVVSVAQNTFQNEFGTDAAGAAWTMTGYTLALAAVIPLSAWAAGRFGTKRVFLTSGILFTLGSALCALATSIDLLVAFRMLQGLGGGLLMPIGMMILTKAAGPERMGSVMAALGIPMLLGPIAGPILGGFLIEQLSWHWIFLINLPIGVIAFIYAAVVLDKNFEPARSTIDVIGLLLLSPGLALFLFGLSGSAEEGTFASTRVLLPAAIGLALIAGFVMHALRTEKPLLDLRLFTNHTLRTALITMTMFAIAFFGSTLLFPQYFIGVRGEGTMMAGLLLAPQGIGAMVTMPIAGRLTDRMGPGKFVLAGVTLIFLGLIPLTFLAADTSYWLIGAALFVQGLGMGMTMTPIMTSALAKLRPTQVPHGSTLLNVTQQTASSIGTALFSVLLATNLSSHKESGLAILSNASEEDYAELVKAGVAPPQPQEQWFEWAASAFGTTFIVACILVAATVIPAFFLPRTRIAPADDAPPMIAH